MLAGLSHNGVLNEPPTGLNRAIHASAQLPSSVLPAINTFPDGEGVLTFFPLATPFGLALGTD